MDKFIPNCNRSFDLDKVKQKLPSLAEKLDYSVRLLQKAEHLALQYDSVDGFWLGFSGGKDSQALYHVAKLAGVKFKAHFTPTTVDPPELIRFIRKHYPDCEFMKLKRSIFTAAIKKRALPTMFMRWCCEEFKENAGAGKVTLIGIRHEESTKRAKRKEVEITSRRFSGTLEQLDTYRKEHAEKESKPHRGRPREGEKFSIVTASGERTLGCINGKESLLISPIIDWTTSEVWDFLNTLGVAHCSLYDEGWYRLGCILCPMASPKLKAKEIERWPHVKKNWIKAIKTIRRERERESSHPSSIQANYGVWGESSANLSDNQENEVAENIFNWWVSGKPYQQWRSEKLAKEEQNKNL